MVKKKRSGPMTKRAVTTSASVYSIGSEEAGILLINMYGQRSIQQH